MQHIRLFALGGVALAVVAAAAADNGEPAGAALISHKIVPATPETRRNGEASLVQLRDNSLLLLYGGQAKPGDWDRGEIRQIRSRDGGRSWSQPQTLFSDPTRSLFQCGIARLPGGDLGLTYSSLAHGKDAIKVFRRSADGGRTWSEPTDLYRATEDGLWVDYPAVLWVDGNLHMAWRHIRNPNTREIMTSLYHFVLPAAAFTSGGGQAAR